MRIFAIAAIAAIITGCVTKNAGSITSVGDHTIYPEITTSDGSLGVRIFESVRGAKVWTTRDSGVKITYSCVTTNKIFGVYESGGDMELEVEITPTEPNPISAEK